MVCLYGSTDHMATRMRQEATRHGTGVPINPSSASCGPDGHDAMAETFAAKAWGAASRSARAKM